MSDLTPLEFLSLADGEGLTLAHDIAVEVGWSPRAAGAKLESLRRGGLVARRRVRGTQLYGWYLTEACLPDSRNPSGE